MFHKILIWISTSTSILGIAFYLIDKLAKPGSKLFSPYVVWSLIAVGVLSGILLAFTEKQGEEGKGSVSQKAIQNNSGIVIGNTGDGGINVTQGDLTTSALKRYEDALQLTRQEIETNFLNTATQISALAAYPPQPFWDTRRPNESEAAFQDRAMGYHRNYIDEVRHIKQKFQTSAEVFKSHQRELSHNAAVAASLKKTYGFHDEVSHQLDSYLEGLMRNIKGGLSDTELASKNLSLFEEKLIEMKAGLCQAASQYVMTLHDHKAIATFRDYFNISGLSISQSTPKELQKEVLQLYSYLYKQKASVIGQRVAVQEEAEKRAINRMISDPYLLLLREKVGLTAKLSEGEAWALLHKTLDQNERDPQNLITLAAFSYKESDGRAAAYYFEKALADPNLSDLQKQFISKSLQRVQQPDLYEGSLGILIYDLQQGGAAQAAGLKLGDVVYKVNGLLVNDPAEIASIMGKSDQDDAHLLEVKRGPVTIKVVLNGGQPLSCKATSLVLLNAVQI